MNPLYNLLASANQLVKFFQGCVWRNRLPIAHHALRVHHLACQHWARVHGKRQNVHGFLATFNFHVGARRLIRQTASGFLRRFVIQHAPKTAHVARAFYLVGFDVVGTCIVRVNLGPIGMGTASAYKGRHGHWHKEEGLTQKGRRIEGKLESFCQHVHVSTIK